MNQKLVESLLEKLLCQSSGDLGFDEFVNDVLTNSSILRNSSNFEMDKMYGILALVTETLLTDTQKMAYCENKFRIYGVKINSASINTKKIEILSSSF